MSHTNAHTERKVLQPSPRSPRLCDFDLLNSSHQHNCQTCSEVGGNAAAIRQSSERLAAKISWQSQPSETPTVMETAELVCVGGGARQQKASDKRLFSSRQDEEMKSPSESVQVVSLECSLDSDGINPVLTAQSQR